MSKKPKLLTVHAAIDRKALCKFDKKDPNKWPSGNYWVHPKSSHKKKVTCKNCKRKM